MVITRSQTKMAEVGDKTSQPVDLSTILAAMEKLEEKFDKSQEEFNKKLDELRSSMKETTKEIIAALDVEPLDVIKDAEKEEEKFSEHEETSCEEIEVVIEEFDEEFELQEIEPLDHAEERHSTKKTADALPIREVEGLQFSGDVSAVKIPTDDFELAVQSQEVRECGQFVYLLNCDFTAAQTSNRFSPAKLLERRGLYLKPSCLLIRRQRENTSLLHEKDRLQYPLQKVRLIAEKGNSTSLVKLNVTQKVLQNLLSLLYPYLDNNPHDNSNTVNI